MIIERPGGYCFKVSAGKETYCLNPPSTKSSLKVNKFGADTVFISSHHRDWNGPETASLGEAEPFVIQGPGSYECGGLTADGYATVGAYEGEEQAWTNTAYLIRFDDMTLLHLGALAEAKLPQELRADIDTIDILCVPVGGATLTPKDANELIVSLEPRLIIPYAVGSATSAPDLDALAAFLKIVGVDTAPVSKLTIRAKEVTAMEGVVAVLE